jgi:glycine/D-amino acid oxidase-like deaminating enzyme
MQEWLAQHAVTNAVYDIDLEASIHLFHTLGRGREPGKKLFGDDTHLPNQEEEKPMLERHVLERLIPEAEATYDVIVAGGGPAGLGAALAAATQGAHTLLLEARSFFGGVAAIAMWMPINRVRLDGGKRGGVHDLFVGKLEQLGERAAVEGKSDHINGDGLDVHPDYLRLAAFELLEACGCHYRLYSPVTGTLMQGNNVRGVEVTGKEGRQRFYAKVVVDATGDGDVAYYAGAEIVEGREGDGQHMPVSLVFALANVDVERALAFKTEQSAAFNALVQEAASEGYHTAAWYSLDRTTVPGTLNVNNGAYVDQGNIDGAKSADLTLAERFGVRVAVDFVRLARAKRIPGLEKCHLMRTGAHVGVRDTRRIVGEYVLTVEDARNGPEFKDVVARKYGAIDANQLYIGAMHSGFAYPYRSLLPKRIDNLLAAGRCGSADFLGHAAGKSMGNMMALGQAAGVAAAMCAAQGVTPRKLNVPQLQAALRAMGAQI